MFSMDSATPAVRRLARSFSRRCDGWEPVDAGGVRIYSGEITALFTAADIAAAAEEVSTAR